MSKRSRLEIEESLWDEIRKNEITRTDISILADLIGSIAGYAHYQMTAMESSVLHKLSHIDKTLDKWMPE